MGTNVKHVSRLQEYYKALSYWLTILSARDRSLALVWYAVEGRPVIKLGLDHGYSAYQACAVYGAMSANARPTANWNLFVQFMKTGNAGTVPVAVNAALRAIATDGIASIDAISVSGFKTKAYAKSCLIANGYNVGTDNIFDARLACLDRWMRRAATSEFDKECPPTAAEYPVMAEALSLVAVDCNLPIWLVQAMIWASVQTARGKDWLANDRIMTEYRTPPIITTTFQSLASKGY